MSCPYLDGRYIGACGASVSKYVPSIERMETYCFQQTYRCCPTLSEYLYENDMAMANYLPQKELSHQ